MAVSLLNTQFTGLSEFLSVDPMIRNMLLLSWSCKHSLGQMGLVCKLAMLKLVWLIGLLLGVRLSVQVRLLQRIFFSAER